MFNALNNSIVVELSKIKVELKLERTEFYSNQDVQESKMFKKIGTMDCT